MGETYTGCSVLGESENVYCKVNITTCVGSLGGLIPLSAYGEDGYGDVCDHRCGFKGEYDYSYGYDYSSPPLTTSGDNLFDTMLAGLFANYYPVCRIVWLFTDWVFTSIQFSRLWELKICSTSYSMQDCLVIHRLGIHLYSVLLALGIEDLFNQFECYF
eukprot:TRINITY_DN2397_c0_g1_i1.p1 TRINITY_DN2397_c0_g1~~TRINITY_DN2397_c0_g1_i1.p1  ORF type:complete len:159 (+),score=3.21 TRINITY_DN2397_c0_g1_i1:3-479(+)